MTLISEMEGCRVIRTLGKLIEELRQAEAVKLEQSDIAHAPTIGAMYEGLTKSLLDRSIPAGLDLRVVSGFVVDGYGGTSGQLDCLLVQGQGAPVPYVDGVFQWHVRDVLAVIEVKKTLFGGDMADAYDQLNSVGKVFSSWVQNKNSKATFDVRPSKRVYAECMGEVVPNDWKNLDPLKHLIWHAIMSDQIAPLRIALGYGGYASENGLRKGFSDFLAANLGKPGYGPAHIPNLIVGDGVSLVKLSGHPYHAQTVDGWWPILASSSVNPSLLILEHLWTRISYTSPAPAMFGDDLDLERLAPFLDAQPRYTKPPAMGWQFRLSKFTAKQLKDKPDFDAWEPTFLDLDQHAVITRLCSDDVSISDPQLLASLQASGRDPTAFFSELVATSLVAVDGDKLTLTTVECKVAVLPDGRFIAGDDNSGRFSRWLLRYVEARRASETPTSHPSGQAGGSL